MASGSSTPDLESARGLLRAREREFAGALARADVDALAGLYTADARVSGPVGPMAVGRDGVRSLLQHLVDSGVERVEFQEEELFAVGELVCERGTARLLRASGTTVVVTRHMTLWKHEDGTWRIHRDWAAQ
jgi:ketosteroid isomerase-like protein